MVSLEREWSSDILISMQNLGVETYWNLWMETGQRDRAVLRILKHSSRPRQMA